MTRDEMIRQLVLERLTSGNDIDRHIHLGNLLENGFPGFRNFTDCQLAAELRVLGPGAANDEADSQFDHLLHDEVFDSSLSAGHGLALNFSSE